MHRHSTCKFQQTDTLERREKEWKTTCNIWKINLVKIEMVAMRKNLVGTNTLREDEPLKNHLVANSFLSSSIY